MSNYFKISPRAGQLLVLIQNVAELPAGTSGVATRYTTPSEIGFLPHGHKEKDWRFVPLMAVAEFKGNCSSQGLS